VDDPCQRKPSSFAQASERGVMSCYHFTFHGYGSWMPDEDDGYVRRGEGRLPQDTKEAAKYRSRMTHEEVEFNESQQQALINEVHVASRHQSLRVHFVATEPTHIHVLVSWKDDRQTAEKVRASIRQSLSRCLAKQFAERKWLSDGGSQRKVLNEEHFGYLVTKYLPEHGGWKWSEEQGLFK
jgi:REP element-mobilizing transposase RayT